MCHSKIHGYPLRDYHGRQAKRERGRQYLVLAALAALQASQDLALNGLDPGVSFLKAAGFKVPRLSCAGNDDELKVLLLCGCKRAG